MFCYWKGDFYLVLHNIRNWSLQCRYVRLWFVVPVPYRFSQGSNKLFRGEDITGQLVQPVAPRTQPTVPTSMAVIFPLHVPIHILFSYIFTYFQAGKMSGSSDTCLNGTVLNKLFFI